MGVQVYHGNPYNGHILTAVVSQVERVTRRAVPAIFLDRGYRSHDYNRDAEIHIRGQGARKTASLALRCRKKRRAPIEPKIGHLKSDNRMDRNHLEDRAGDRINALLAGVGANMRKLLATFWRTLGDRVYFEEFCRQLLPL